MMVRASWAAAGSRRRWMSDRRPELSIRKGVVQSIHHVDRLEQQLVGGIILPRQARRSHKPQAPARGRQAHTSPKRQRGGGKPTQAPKALGLVSPALRLGLVSPALRAWGLCPPRLALGACVTFLLAGVIAVGGQHSRSKRRGPINSPHGSACRPGKPPRWRRSPPATVAWTLASPRQCEA